LNPAQFTSAFQYNFEAITGYFNKACQRFFFPYFLLPSRDLFAQQAGGYGSSCSDANHYVKSKSYPAELYVRKIKAEAGVMTILKSSFTHLSWPDFF